MRRTIALLATLLAACGTRPPLTEAELIEKARGIHERVLTLDTHKDISDALATRAKSEDPGELLEHRRRFDPTFDGNNQVDFPKSRAGGYDCAFYIVFVSQPRDLTRAGHFRSKQRANVMFNAIERMLDRHPDHIELARTADDVERIHASGKLVCCIGIENGSPMGDNIANIEEFFDRGARYMSITHNRHNQLGDSHTPAEPMHGGLTDLGERAVLEMNRLGIMVDISHSAKSTMLDVLATTRAPVIASHSGCRTVCNHSRNLDDEQLLALKRNGGVIQMVALDGFVKDQTERDAARDELAKAHGMKNRWEIRQAMRNGDDVPPALQTAWKDLEQRFPPANVANYVDHVDHAVDLIGIDHVAIASDFDGGGGIDGWRNASETFNVTLEMVRRGYTEKQIAKIWSGNTLRLWRDVSRRAAEIQSGD